MSEISEYEIVETTKKYERFKICQKCHKVLTFIGQKATLNSKNYRFLTILWGTLKVLLEFGSFILPEITILIILFYISKVLAACALNTEIC